MRRTRKTTKKPPETSKLILAGSWVSTIIMTALTVACTFCGFDASGITTLACLAWGELTAAHGFYYWKAKNENRAKGAQKMVKDLASSYDLEAVARLAEIVYKE